jgi:hypothetical protein
VLSRIAIGLILGAAVGLPAQALFSSDNYGRVWLTLILAGGISGLTYHLGFSAAKKNGERQRLLEAQSQIDFVDRIDRLEQHLRDHHDKTVAWIKEHENELIAAHQTEHREGRTHYVSHEGLP